jgi:4-amino-4-deoxy-L-arabinose transferase-like glycosyltransferase
MKPPTADGRPDSAAFALTSPQPHPAAVATASPWPVPAAPDARPTRAPVAGIALIAAAAVGLELAVSARYGYHRDELYFLAAGHHPAFGYVDQPAMTPLLARISSAVFGNSLAGLRVIPALAMAGLIVITAALSRMLGAGRTGQLLAALATATCAEYLGTAHLLTTTVPDFLAWGIMLVLVMRLLASEDQRWWLAIGACAGIGADAKWNIGFLVAALAAGFALTPARKLLMSRCLLAGAMLAAALASPDVIWQAAHGWPNLDVFRVLQGAAWHNRAAYWPAQLVYTGLAIAPVWMAGLAWSLRSEAARRFRPVAIACTIAGVLFFVLGGKPYYNGAVYLFLFAAGSVPLERWLSGRRPLAGRIPAAALMITAMLASAAVAVPVAIPVLPAATLHVVPLQKINYDLAETIAWPGLVALIGREYHSLPASQRRRTTVLAGNYGEAGAVDRYGPQSGLPQAYSGANNFWFWGPPPAADTSAVVVNMDPAFLRRQFAHVRQVATFRNGLGVSDDEQGARVFIVSGLRSTWKEAWPSFRDLS